MLSDSVATKTENERVQSGKMDSDSNIKTHVILCFKHCLQTNRPYHENVLQVYMFYVIKCYVDFIKKKI